MFEKMKPSSLRFATTMAAIGLVCQALAFVMPYLEYFEVVNFGVWFLAIALLLNLASISFLLFFFVTFYKALIALLRGMNAKQSRIDPVKK